MKKQALIFCAAAGVAVMFSGCLGPHFGGGTRTSVHNQSQTYDVSLGQQLIDLQKAHDQGIITDHEYNAQKKKLLRHYVR